uniref:Uncharacterized protein n=1 Tax=Arundo donax TaxID=35708 RepID=A0A0A9CFZ0_ARUDO
MRFLSLNVENDASFWSNKPPLGEDSARAEIRASIQATRWLAESVLSCSVLVRVIM